MAAMPEQLALEGNLLRVAHEQLRREVRSGATGVEKELRGLKQQSPDDGDEPRGDADRQVQELEERLRGYKRRLVGATEAEAAHVRRCKARVDHLVGSGYCRGGGEAPTPEEEQAFVQARVDRAVAEHMVRQGCGRSAARLMADAGIGDLVDAELIDAARRMRTELRAGDAGRALAWCAKQRSALKKLGSDLEFQLRLQEYVRMVRRRELRDAIAYARDHLRLGRSSPAAQRRQLLQAMALLALREDLTGKDELPEPYRALCSDERWVELDDKLGGALAATQSLPPTPLLHSLMESGLSALKTPGWEISAEQSRGQAQYFCQSQSPFTSAPIRQLAAAVPLASHSDTRCAKPSTFFAFLIFLPVFCFD